MFTAVDACGKGSGTVADMLDVSHTCYNFCPCGNSAWCGLHSMDVAVRENYLIHY
jgi:hypothetical protein